MASVDSSSVAGDSVTTVLSILSEAGIAAWRARVGEEEANRIIEQMQNEFCRKHRFELKSEFGNYTIHVYTNR